MDEDELDYEPLSNEAVRDEYKGWAVCIWSGNNTTYAEMTGENGVYSSVVEGKQFKISKDCYAIEERSGTFVEFGQPFTALSGWSTPPFFINTAARKVKIIYDSNNETITIYKIK